MTDQLEKLLLEEGNGRKWVNLFDILKEYETVEESFVNSVLHNIEKTNIGQESLSMIAAILLRLCRLCPKMTPPLLLSFIDIIKNVQSERVVGDILSELAQTIRILNNYMYNGFGNLLTELLAVKNFLAIDLMQHASNAGVIIRAALVLQKFCLCWSRKTGMDSEMEINDLSLEDLTQNSKLKASQVKDEGIKTLDKLISLLWREVPIPYPATLALLNILGRISQMRPVFLSKIIPAFVSFYESIPNVTLKHQINFLEHTLERQFARLMENASAEKFYPLIVEVLKKGNKSTLNKRRKVEEDEDEVDLTVVGTTKKVKVELKIDISKVGLLDAVGIVIATLKNNSLDNIKGALNKWRPAEIASIRDPRRAPEPLEMESKDNKSDQIVPFELKSVSHSNSDESSQMFCSILKNALETLSDLNLILLDTKERKTRIKALFRLTTMANNDDVGFSGVSEVLLNYCFESITLRLGFLTYWLRLLWIQQKNEQYEQIFTDAISRLQVLASENVSQWEIALQKFFLDAPVLLSSELHLILLKWLCDNQTTRPSAMAILEQLIINRPSVRQASLNLIMEYCHNESEPLRSVALGLICDRLFQLCNEFITEKALDSLDLDILNTATKDSVASLMEFPLRLATKDKQCLDKILSSFDSMSEECRSYVIHQATKLAATFEDSVLTSLFISVNLKSHLSEFLCQLIPAVLKTRSLDPSITDHAFSLLSKDEFPMSTFDSLLPSFKNNDQIISLAEKFLLSKDLNDDSIRPEVVSIITKICEKVDPIQFFMFLHCSPNLSLKKSVEAIQICLSMTHVFKPEVVTSAIKLLVDLPELPPMLMRTIIQSFTLNKAMTSFAVGMLSRLGNREVWNMPKPWEGFIRCIRALSNYSYAVLLQLPIPQLKEVLEAIPELRAGFVIYVEQQSAVIQSRYKDVEFMTLNPSEPT